MEDVRTVYAYPSFSPRDEVVLGSVSDVVRMLGMDDTDDLQDAVESTMMHELRNAVSDIVANITSNGDESASLVIEIRQ